MCHYPDDISSGHESYSYFGTSDHTLYAYSRCSFMPIAAPDAVLKNCMSVNGAVKTAVQALDGQGSPKRGWRAPTTALCRLDEHMPSPLPPHCLSRSPFRTWTDDDRMRRFQTTTAITEQQIDDGNCSRRYSEVALPVLPLCNLADETIVRRVHSHNIAHAASFLDRASSPCHFVTVVPQSPTGTTGTPQHPEPQHGFSRALQLGSRVNFLPIRKAASSRDLPLYPLDASLPDTKLCLVSAVRSQEAAVTERSCIIPALSHIQSDTQRDKRADSLKLFPHLQSFVPSQKSNTELHSHSCVSQSWDDDKVLTLRACRPHRSLSDFTACKSADHETVGVKGSESWDGELRQRAAKYRKVSDEQILELQAFSVQLASLLHQGFSSTVWLCNSNTPLTSTEENSTAPPPHVAKESTGRAVCRNETAETSSKRDQFYLRTRSAEVTMQACNNEDVSTTAYVERAREELYKSSPVLGSHGEDDNEHVSVTCTTIREADSSKETSVVMKVVHKTKCTPDELERLLSEAEILSEVSHPHIIRLLAVVHSETEEWMFFEHAPFGDLHSATKFKIVTEDACRWIVFQLLLALRNIHETHRIIHGDIKPQNILLFRDTTLYDQYQLKVASGSSLPYDSGSILSDSGVSSIQGIELWKSLRLKLSDFGLAQLIPEGVAEMDFDGLKGTHGYLAPELLLRQSYNCKVDMWALGIIAFSLIGGYEPFYPVSACIKEDVEFELRYWGHISGEAKDFIRSLLQRTPAKRLSASQALQHDWINYGFRIPAAS